MNKKYLLFGGTAALLIFVFLAAAAYYREEKAAQYGFLARENAELFVRPHSQTLGSPDAGVYLVEFMDPACETCADFFPFVKQLMAAYPGKIRLVLRYAPFHDGADYFVTILEAAKKQGKYWETLDVMYRSQQYWASHHNPQPEKIWKFLPMAGVDVAQLRQDMNDPAISRLIAQDLADAKRLGVEKTPGFFVNGKPLQTFGYQQLRQLVHNEVTATYPQQ